MSKKHNQDNDSPESEFKRIVDEFSASVDKMTLEFDQKNEPLVDDSEEDENEETLPWFRFWSIFPFLYHLTVAGAKKTVSFGSFLIRNTIALPLHAASFFKRKKANNSENAEKISNAPKPALTQPTTKIAVSDPKPAAATPKSTASNPKTTIASPVDVVDDEFDDESRKFSWLGLGFKVTAAAAIALLITGGYYGVKSFLGKPKIEEIVQSEPPAANAPTPVESFAPQVAVSENSEKVTSQVQLKSEPKSPFEPPKPADTKKNVVINPKETESKLPTPSVDKETAKTNPKTELKAPAPPTFKETAPTETAADPFATLANSITPEKSKPTSPDASTADPWNLAMSNSAAPVTSNSFNDLFNSTNSSVTPPEATPKPPALEPPTLTAQPEKPLTLDHPIASTNPPVVPNPVPDSAFNSAFDSLTMPSPSPANAAPVISAQTKPATSSNLAPLELPKDNTASQLVPLRKSTDDPKPINEQTLAIPKSKDDVQSVSPALVFSQPSSKTAADKSTGFSKAPMPPEIVSAIPPSTVEPPMPVIIAKKDEIVPTIPNSGSVQQLAITPVPVSPTTREPSLGIPSDSVAFEASAAPKLAAAIPATKTADALQPPAFTPPTLEKDAPNLATKSTSAIPATMKFSEPVPAIPKDSSPVTPLAATTSNTPSAMIPAMLPQHEELAKIEPPLGSQLQKQVQEIRSQDNSESEPKLRFGSGSNVQIGAVRYHPKATVTATSTAIQPLPMLTEPESPASNSLQSLLPAGNAEAGMEDSLPSLASAPQPVYATPNPGYRHWANQNIPATTKPEAATAMTATNGERRASLFRRINEEIKRSPANTEQYTVQANDTYLTISDQFFGTGKLFRALAEYNRQKFGTDYKLVEGTIIEIPTADYLKANFAEAFSRGRWHPENSSTVTSTNYSVLYSTQQLQGLRYIVQEGDTIFRIATNQLRDSSRWQEIMQLNSALLHDPRDLQPGMEIILPTTTAMR